jgi:hypothetical protein
MNNIKIIRKKTGKPQNRISGFLETKDDNQIWDGIVAKKMTVKGTQISSST